MEEKSLVVGWEEGTKDMQSGERGEGEFECEGEGESEG